MWEIMEENALAIFEMRSNIRFPKDIFHPENQLI